MGRVSAPPAAERPGRPGRTGWRDAAVTAAVGGGVVAALFRYNLGGASAATGLIGRTWEEYLLVNVAALLGPALLTVLVVLRERAGSWGLRPAAPGAARIAWALYGLMLPVLIIAASQPEFHHLYPLQPQAADSWRRFAYHEITYAFYMLCWEFFFRGFLLSGLRRGIGFTAANVAQAAAFCVLHLGKPAPEVAGSFVAGLALGWLAARARSFLPGFAVHAGVSTTFDVLAIHARGGGIL